MTERAWPADKIERRNVADLLPYARNARTHSDEQVAQIAASIREWGWTTPVLVDEGNTIIAGHGRVMAANKLGITDVPVMVASGWTDAQKKAYVLADNKLAENAGWDTEKLRVELGDLQASGFDMPVIGFSDDELTSLLFEQGNGLTDPNDAPEVPVNSVTELGDVWICGNHRVRCGDSTKAGDVEALLAGVSPNLMVTDPPYGVEYDAKWREDSGLGGKNVAKGKVLNDDRADWTETWTLFPGNVCYVWHGALHNVEVSESLIRAGFQPRSQIVWVKTRAPISRGNYHWQHEPAFYAERGEEKRNEGWNVEQSNAAYFVRAGNRADWHGGRKQTTVWFIEHLKNDTGHSTQKPVECMRRPIVNNSSPGQAVYDPFLGSGSTLIAAEMEGRICYGMELNPLYVDVIVQRWQEFTGREARLEGAGDTFADVKNTRHGGVTTGAGKVKEQAH